MGQVVGEKCGELDVLTILSLGLHLNELSGYLLSFYLLLIRFGLLGLGLLRHDRLLLFDVLCVCSSGSSVFFGGLASRGRHLGDLLALVQVVSGDGHADVLVNFWLIVESGLDRLDNTGWLVDLLALQY